MFFKETTWEEALLSLFLAFINLLYPQRQQASLHHCWSEIQCIN